MRYCRIQELIEEAERFGLCDTEGFPGPWLREVVDSPQFNEAVAIVKRVKKGMGGYLNENFESWSFNINCIISVDIPTSTSKYYEHTLNEALEDAVDWEWDQPDGPITIPEEEIVDGVYRKLLYRAIEMKESTKKDKVFKIFNDKVFTRARAYWKVLTDLEPDLFPITEIYHEINLLESELENLENDTTYEIKDEFLLGKLDQESNSLLKNTILDWIEKFKELQDEMNKLICKMDYAEYMKMLDS